MRLGPDGFGAAARGSGVGRERCDLRGLLPAPAPAQGQRPRRCAHLPALGLPLPLTLLDRLVWHNRGRRSDCVGGRDAAAGGGRCANRLAPPAPAPGAARPSLTSAASPLDFDAFDVSAAWGVCARHGSGAIVAEHRGGRAAVRGLGILGHAAAHAADLGHDGGGAHRQAALRRLDAGALPACAGENRS